VKGGGEGGEGLGDFKKYIPRTAFLNPPQKYKDKTVKARTTRGSCEQDLINSVK
jgi:hypothetical protein